MRIAVSYAFTQEYGIGLYKSSQKTGDLFFEVESKITKQITGVSWERKGQPFGDQGNHPQLSKERPVY